MASSPTLCTEGGVGDASWLSVLPGTEDPTDKNSLIVSSGGELEL